MYANWVNQINQNEGGFDQFSKGYDTFGLHAQKDNSISYKEWAPNAVEASLIGDFSKLIDPIVWGEQVGASRAPISARLQTVFIWINSD